MSLVSYRAVVDSGSNSAIFFAAVPPPPPPDPPHAMRASPTIMRAGANLRRFMRLTSQMSISCRLLPGSSGARVRRQTGLTQSSPGGIRQREHCSRGEVCQEIDTVDPHNVRTLDKQADVAMIAFGRGRHNK